MATIRLTPSTHYLSSTNYLSVSDASNMYDNTDNETYATVTNSQTGTTSYYIYLRGFNFSSLPAGVIINSFTVKLKARESGISTNSSYAPKLCHGTSQITSTCSEISSTASVHTFTGVSADWEDIVGYGSDFGIRINCRRSNRNTTGHMYIYGAEILVDYTVPVYHNITITNDTSVNVVASSTNTIEGSNVTISTDTLNGITVKDNNVDVTSQFVQGISDSVSKAPESQTNSGLQSGSNYAAYAVGKTAEDPYSSTNNMYASQSSTGHVDYAFDFSSIPSGASILSVQVKVNGHRENSTIDSTHVANIQLMSGSVNKGSDQDFTSTSNSTITISDVGTWTRNELQDAKLRFTVGYYGGLVCGITWSVTYEIDGYMYTITNVTEDHTIVVSTATQALPIRVKMNNVWVTASKLFVKQNNVWVQSLMIKVKDNGSWN